VANSSGTPARWLQPSRPSTSGGRWTRGTRSCGYAVVAAFVFFGVLRRARVWDANGQVSAWSDPAFFTVELLDSSDWSAKWIEDTKYTYQTNGEPNPLPVFGTEFDTRGRVESARLYATGLGQYAATLNGKPIGEAVLEPGQTSYWKEVNYRTYDV
jgi:hypothetical protein